MQIYFDRDQCEQFDISYFGDGQIALRADVILTSKRQGYDQHHKDFLKPLDNQVVRLWKRESCAPGWYTVGS